MSVDGGESHAASGMTGRAVFGRSVAERLAGAAGLVAAFSMLVGSLVTAAAYRGTQGEAYSPLNHFVSELGEPSVSTLAPLFNAGLIVGGSCLAILLVTLAARLERPARSAVAAAFGLLSGAAGALVGVFTIDTLGTHRLVALTFFASAWISVAIYSVPIGRGRWPEMSRGIALVGWASVAAFIAFLVDVVRATATATESASAADPLEVPSLRPAVWDVATLEWLTIAGILLWVALVSIALLRRPRAAP